jgi:hypothetical protein
MAPQVPIPQYPPAAPQVIVQALQAKNASVAKVTVVKNDWNKLGWEPEYKFEVSESAKREQGDVYDPLTGELMSQGRAFQRLGREMVNEANKRVKADVQARAEAEARKNQPKRPVHRRTREEWEAIQIQRARREEAYAAREEAETQHIIRGKGTGAIEIVDAEPEEYGHFSSVAGVPSASSYTGVMSRNNSPEPSQFGLRINLSDGRYLAVQDGWVIAVVPGQNPVKLTRA